MDIFTFNSKANAAIAYKNLIKEIFDLWAKNSM
jgi:hypothetical protein